MGENAKRIGGDVNRGEVTVQLLTKVRRLD